MKQYSDIKVSQGSLNNANRTEQQFLSPFFATVKKVYSDRMTCDLEGPDGGIFPNVPVLTRSGLIDSKPYGDFWMPGVDDVVIVLHAGYGSQQKVIIGTIVPYLTNEYNDDAVNSESKAYTKKLLEEETENHTKSILKNGVSVETKKDGTIVVETPSGAYIMFDETASEVTIKDANGNSIVMDSSSVMINDNLEVLQ